MAALMPPVGQKRRSGKGPPSAFSMPMPPACCAGKSLSSVKPAARAAITSDGVITPGSSGSALSLAAAISSGVSPGLTPILGVLQDQGFRVALVTDGRMSGASGKVPAAIHLTPECLAGGPLALVRDGDLIVLDGERGVLEVRVVAAEWRARQPAGADLGESHHGMGRELFAAFRANALGAEEGAVTFHAAESGASTGTHVAPVHDHFAFAQGATG